MSKVFFCKNCNKFARILDDQKCEVCRMSIDEIDFLFQNHPEFFKQNGEEVSKSKQGLTETRIIEIEKQEIKDARDILSLEKDKDIIEQIDTNEMIEKQIKEEEDRLVNEEIELEKERERILRNIQLEEDRLAEEEETRLAEEIAKQEAELEETRLAEEKAEKEKNKQLLLEQIQLEKEKTKQLLLEQKEAELEEAKLLKAKEKAEKEKTKQLLLEEAKFLKEQEKAEKEKAKQLLLEQVQAEKAEKEKTKQLLLEQIQLEKEKTKKLEEEKVKQEAELEEVRLVKEAEETKKLVEEATEMLMEDDNDNNALTDTLSIDLDIDKIIEPNFDSSALKENNSISKSKLIESMDFAMDDLSSWTEDSEENKTINLKNIDTIDNDEGQELDIRTSDFNTINLEDDIKTKIIEENNITNEDSEPEQITSTQVSTTTVLTSRLNLESVKTSANTLMDKIIKFLTLKRDGKPIKNILSTIGNLSFLDKNDKKKFSEIWKKLEFISSLDDESKISKDHVIQIFDAEIWVEDIILLN